ncbi:MAG: type II toxin-antitoxin system VapC family toxin [Spirochaetes bacterium]|nr:type II toxin-antitoxin system VapC family toxin [Spirochaetota bacterium]
MIFWDSSAIVPLITREAASQQMLETYKADTEMLVWWATELECVSAICRRERETALHAGHTSAALGRLKRLVENWHEVQAGDRVKSIARRLLRTHNLRTADALQLAAAILLGGSDVSRISFLTLDDRLRLAADKEGLYVVG